MSLSKSLTGTYNSNEIRVFKSLNCCLCKAPFSPEVDHPRCPKKLFCGYAICSECFTKEKEKKKPERKHKCDNNDCFGNKNVAYFLTELLGSDSLALSPNKDGWIIANTLKIPECPICLRDYIPDIRGKSPYDLYCNHTICTDCFVKTRKREVGSMYTIRCPICISPTKTSKEKERNQLQVFITELPKMQEQFERILALGHRFCEDCKEIGMIDRMFDCQRCEKKVCGTCAYKEHNNHRAGPLAGKESFDLSKELLDDSRKYFDQLQASILPMNEAIAVILSQFKEKLLEAESKLKGMTIYKEFEKDYTMYRKMIKNFETISNDYQTALKNYHESIEGMIEVIDKHKS